MKKKRVLVVGNLYALVKRISMNAEEVFVAPGNSEIAEIAKCVDIREDEPNELLKFALENDIDLTIAISEKAIKSDISSVFQANEMKIFAPTAKSAECVLNKSAGKKFLYKLHAPTPKFGIFEKSQLAVDYLKTASFPIVISADSVNSQKYCCTTFERAKYHIEDLFISGEERVVIQDFVYGSDFTFYAVSDGYHVVPVATVRDFKFSENGDGGVLTSGVGTYVPDNEISFETSRNMFNEVILNAIKTLESKEIPYMGIFGADMVLTKNGYSVLNFRPFFSDVDAQAVLNSVDEDLLELFEACANGFFADEYDDILTNSNISVSCLVKPKSKEFLLSDPDIVDSEISKCAGNYIFTSSAKTLSRAKKIIKDDLEKIGLDKIKFRSDIIEC